MNCDKLEDDSERRQRLASTLASTTEVVRPGLSEHFGWTVVSREKVRDGTFPHLTRYRERMGRERVDDIKHADTQISRESEDHSSVSEDEENVQELHSIEGSEELPTAMHAISTLEEPVVSTLETQPSQNKRHLISNFFYKRYKSVKKSESKGMRKTSGDYYELENFPYGCSTGIGNCRGDFVENTSNGSEEEFEISKNKRSKDVDERQIRGFARWALCFGSELDDNFLENRRRGMRSRASSEPRIGSKLIGRLKYDPQKYGRGGAVPEKLLASSELSVPNKYLFVVDKNKQTI
uniref:Uncharacterized protein n=1 Tax=Graphocephala atropunctata TaxID=36148 RepID=A0A1B6LLP0_9HEMI